MVLHLIFMIESRQEMEIPASNRTKPHRRRKLQQSLQGWVGDAVFSQSGVWQAALWGHLLYLHYPCWRTPRKLTLAIRKLTLAIAVQIRSSRTPRWIWTVQLAVAWKWTDLVILARFPNRSFRSRCKCWYLISVPSEILPREKIVMPWSHSRQLTAGGESEFIHASLGVRSRADAKSCMPWGNIFFGWGSWYQKHPKMTMKKWIGLRGNLQETMVFTIKYRGFL